MRYELTDFEWTAIVGPRVPDAAQRLLAVRRRAGPNQGVNPLIQIGRPTSALERKTVAASQAAAATIGLIFVGALSAFFDQDR